MRFLFWLLTALGALFLGGLVPHAFAQEAAAGGAHVLGPTVKAALAIGSGIGIGIAAGLGALAQGRAAAAAVSGIARNPGAAPKIQTAMIIGLALIESLVIYALAIAFLLQNRI